jgi:hypothetical protein
VNNAPPELGDGPGPGKNQPTSVRSNDSLLTFFWNVSWCINHHCVIRPVKSLFAFLPLFPLGMAGGIRGLIQHFKPNTNFQSLRSLGETLFAPSYVTYFALFAVFCRVRKWKWFWTSVVILFCFLVLNVAGCHAMLKQGFRGPE